MTNNTNKQTLLNLFADNVSGEITATTLRDFVSRIFDDSEVVINRFNSLDAFEAAVSEERADIYEGSLVAITDSTDEENGLYKSLINQPSTRDFLKQISNNVSVAPSLEKIPYEFNSFDGQYIFDVEYKDNLVDFYDDGAKIPPSGLILNSTPTANGTRVVLTEPLAQDSTIEIVCYV